MLAPVGVFLLGAVIAVLLPRFPRLPYAFTLAGSVASAGIALAPREDEILRVSLGSIAPFAALNFRLDGLSAYFLLIIGVLVGAVSAYALGYVDRRHYGGWASGAAFCAFVAAMAGVVLADGVFSFLLFWELMSLASFVLVVHDHQVAEVRRAGFIYLAMAHAGAGFVVAGFLLLAGQAGSLDFQAFRDSAGSLQPLVRNGAFVLFLVGFAAKAGVIPLHVWLPRAHPAAPSHVSALMSGVMIKLGIYGMVRVFFELLAPAEEWWGWLLLLLGVSSAVLGVLYALMEHDLKRLLAYHSVANIGIILIGVGSGIR
ncbi:MAG: proton-conducting transporter membrane subunit, partial [Chloroflexota bacterium]